MRQRGRCKRPADRHRTGGSSLLISSHLFSLAAADTINSIAGNMQLNHPYIYDSSLSASLAKIYPNVSALISGSHVSGVRNTQRDAEAENRDTQRQRRDRQRQRQRQRQSAQTKALSSLFFQSETNVMRFATSGGAAFIQFAKTGTWGNDLYEDLVQPYFKESKETKGQRQRRVPTKIDRTDT